MSDKSYFARVSNRSLNPHMSRIIEIEPALKSPEFLVLPYYTVFYSNVS